MGEIEPNLPSPNWTLCPRRAHFVMKTGSLLRGEKLKLPLLVLPQRQCLTKGDLRTISHETYSEQLKEFTDVIFHLPLEAWESIPITSGHLRKVSATDQINEQTFKVWRYPGDLLDSENSRQLPLYRAEWVWEKVPSPKEALKEMRKMYFDSTYVDDESDISLVEHLGAYQQNKHLKCATVFRALWRPRPLFSTRDWLEFVFVDEQTSTVISRSCLHPDHAEYHLYATWLHKLLFKILPGIGIYRAGAYYSIRFSDPPPNKKGCIVELCFWYSMGGLPDSLARTGLGGVEDEYIASVARQFNGMTTRYSPKVSPPSAAFDLL